MAFLSINGIDLNVRGGQVQREDANGRRGFSINGTPYLSRSNSPRRWRFTTPLLSGAELNAIEKIIAHKGEMWRFSGLSGGTDYANGAPSYSDRGLPHVGAGDVYLLASRGVEGSRVYRRQTDTTFEPVAPFDWCDGVVHSGSSFSNLLTSAQSVAETTGPYTAYNGATLANNTNNVWQGTGSLDCTLTAVSGGATIAGVSVSSTTNYVATVHFKFEQVATTTGTVTLNLRSNPNVSGVTSTTLTIDLDTNDDRDAWYRIDHRFTTGGSDTSVDIEAFVSGAASTDILYLDGWQLTQKSLLRPWIEGGSSASDSASEYDGSMLDGVEGITLACWFDPYVQLSGIKTIFSVGDVATLHKMNFQLYTSGTFLRAQLSYSDETAPSYFSLAQSDILSVLSGWVHIAGTADLTTGEVKVYHNGTLLATTDNLGGANEEHEQHLMTTLGFETNEDKEIRFLNSLSSATAYDLGSVALPMIIPEKLTDDQISDLYNNPTDGGGSQGMFPLHISGDALGTTRNVKCVGRVTGRTYQPIGLGDGTWDNTAGTLSFELTEVL